MSVFCDPCSETKLNKKSQVVDTTKDIDTIVAQRDKLQVILIQRDMTIEHLLSEGKENENLMLRKQQIDGKRREDHLVQSANGQLGNSKKTLNKQTIEQSSISKVKYEQMRLECSLLKDINESILEDNESLKMVNRILQSNYDILRHRLDTVQTEHQLRLTQFHDANEFLNKSLKNARTKRVRSDQIESVETPGTHNKRRRLAGIRSDNNSKIGEKNGNGSLDFDVGIECSSDSSSANAIDNDLNGDEEFLEDDLEYVPIEPICINLDDISDGEEDCETNTGSEDSKFSSSSSEDDTLIDDDLLVESSFVKLLSQYSIVRQLPTTVDNQPPKPGE